VIQKHPGNEAQILAPNILKGAVHFEKGKSVVRTPVYLYTRWVSYFAFFRML